MSPLTLAYNGQLSYRVIRRGWRDPLDAGYSQQRTDNRWNTADFPVLYCCCAEAVARAVARDIFRFAAVTAADLQPAFRPQLAEIDWSGEVIDVVTRNGIRAARFPAGYPNRVTKPRTQRAAADWHAAGAEGVVYRSASLFRRGFTRWQGPFRVWSELAIFVRNVRTAPALVSRRDDLAWLE